MVYEIRRDADANMVEIRFAGEVPVEVREALLKNGFSWQDYRKSWASIDRHEDRAIRAIIDGAAENVAERKPLTKEEEKALREEYMVRMMAGEDDHWRKYYEGEIGAIVKLTDGRLVNIEKPRIRTDFCFGESGYDFDDAVRMSEVARTRESYFLDSNLEDLRRTVAFLSRDPGAESFSQLYAVVTDDYKAGIADFHMTGLFDHWGKKCHEEVSEEDRERLLEGYRKVYAAFEKRLKAYLKRYGLSKIRSWTYWRDA